MGKKMFHICFGTHYLLVSSNKKIEITMAFWMQTNRVKNAAEWAGMASLSRWKLKNPSWDFNILDIDICKLFKTINLPYQA